MLLICGEVFYIWPKAKTIENLFSYIDASSNLLPITCYLIAFQKIKKNIGFRIVVAYLLIVLSINALIVITSYTNTLLYEIQTLVEYLLFAGFIYSQLKKPFAKRLLLICSASFTVFFFAYTFSVESVGFLDSIPIGIESILILAFGFYYLYQETNDTTTLFIYSKAEFWITLGIVLYLAGNFFIYIFTNILSAKEVYKYWFVTNLFSILKNIFFSIAMFVEAKPPKPPARYDLDLSTYN